jgi:hypothetical protein
MNKTIDTAQAAKRSLLQYTAVLAGMCTFLQVFIAVRGNHIDVLSQVMLGVVALYYVWYHYREKTLLSKVRFGRLVAHLVGFLVVNLSYHIHGYFLLISNSAAIRGDEHFWIETGWFGVLFGMSMFWGLGLAVHTIASIANRGFEELPKA